MAEQIFIKDSIIEAQIQKKMELQRLYGIKEAIETHLSLCENDSKLYRILQKSLDEVNEEIMVFKSEI